MNNVPNESPPPNNISTEDKIHGILVAVKALENNFMKHLISDSKEYVSAQKNEEHINSEKKDIGHAPTLEEKITGLLSSVLTMETKLTRITRILEKQEKRRKWAVLWKLFWFFVFFVIPLYFSYKAISSLNLGGLSEVFNSFSEIKNNLNIEELGESLKTITNPSTE